MTRYSRSLPRGPDVPAARQPARRQVRAPRPCREAETSHSGVALRCRSSTDARKRARVRCARSVCGASRHATNRADQQNRATSRRRAATADSRREFARATQAPARRRGNSFRYELRKKAHPDIAREPRSRAACASRCPPGTGGDWMLATCEFPAGPLQLGRIDR